MRIGRLPVLRIVLAVVAMAAAGSATWGLARYGPASQFASGGGRAAHAGAGHGADVLVERPLDGAPFLALGDAEADFGNPSAAEAFYRIAARREPRNALVRVKLVNFYTAGGDAASAAQHLDALLRISPDTGAPLLRRMLSSIDEEASRTALASRLATDPPWRDTVPAALATAASPAAAEAFLAALGELAPMRPAEVALRATLLEQAGRASDARAFWRGALPPELRKLDGLVFDGGFEHGEGPEPYGWRLVSPIGAAVGRDTSLHARGDSALALLFDGRVVDFSGVSQDIVLKPGLYELHVLADVQLDAADRPFAWSIACRGSNAQVARLPLPARTNGWQPFSTRFEVPPACPTQQLALVHEGRNLTERRLAGRMAFDALRIEGSRQ